MTTMDSNNRVSADVGHSLWSMSHESHSKRRNYMWTPTHPSLIQDSKYPPNLRAYAHTAQLIALDLPRLHRCATPVCGFDASQGATLPLTGELLYGIPTSSSPSPGEIPSCLLYDELIQEDHNDRKRLPESGTSRFSSIPQNTQVMGEGSWAVVSLAYNPVFLRETEAGERKFNHKGGVKLRMNRLKRKIYEELPFPERPLDFVESCAIESAAGAPTREEAQQNLASMEVFRLGWLQQIECETQRQRGPLLVGGDDDALYPSPMFSREVNKFMDEEFMRSGVRGGWPECYPTSPRKVSRTQQLLSVPSRPKISRLKEKSLGERLRGILEQQDRNLGIVYQSPYTPSGLPIQRTVTLKLPQLLEKQNVGVQPEEVRELVNRIESRLLRLKGSKQSHRVLDVELPSPPSMFQTAASHGSTIPGKRRLDSTLHLADVQRALTAINQRTMYEASLEGSEAQILNQTAVTEAQWIMGMSFHSINMRTADRAMNESQVTIGPEFGGKSVTAQLQREIEGSRITEDVVDIDLQRRLPRLRSSTFPRMSGESSSSRELPGGLTFMNYSAMNRPEDFFMTPFFRRSASLGTRTFETPEGPRQGKHMDEMMESGVLDFEQYNPEQMELEIAIKTEGETPSSLKERTGCAYHEEDISTGFYWEETLEEQRRSDSIAEKAANAIPLEVVRARRLLHLDKCKREEAQKKLVTQKRQEELKNASVALYRKLELRKEKLAWHERLHRSLKGSVHQGRRQKIKRLEGKEKGHIDESDCEIWSYEFSSKREGEGLLSDEELKEIDAKFGVDTDSDEEIGTATKKRRKAFTDSLNIEQIKLDLKRVLIENRKQELERLTPGIKSESHSCRNDIKKMWRKF